MTGVSETSRSVSSALAFLRIWKYHKRVNLIYWAILCAAALGWVFYLGDVGEEQTGQIQAALQPSLLCFPTEL